MRYINSAKEPAHEKVIQFAADTDEGAVEVAMQWNGSYTSSVFSFANNINTHEGGSHLTGFKAALTSTLNRYARDQGVLKEKDENLSGDDVLEGLAAIVSVKLREPQFEGQTKTKLGNPFMAGFVQQATNEKLAEFLEENPNEGRVIVQKAVQAARARLAARKARDTRPQERVRQHLAARQAGRLPVEGPEPVASCSWSRATPPAARPSTAATPSSRPSCRCAARS